MSKSVCQFWPRHFAIKNFFERYRHVLSHGQRNADPRLNVCLGNTVAVLNQRGETYVNVSAPNPHLSKNVGTERLNCVAVNNLNFVVAKPNHFSVLSHPESPSLKTRFGRACRAFVNAWRAA